MLAICLAYPYEKIFVVVFGFGPFAPAKCTYLYKKVKIFHNYSTICLFIYFFMIKDKLHQIDFN